MSSRSNGVTNVLLRRLITVVRQPVPLVLGLADRGERRSALRPPFDQLEQEPRDLAAVRRARQ